MVGLRNGFYPRVIDVKSEQSRYERVSDITSVRSG